MRAGSIARRDVPTCSVDEPVGSVAARIGDWPVAVVVQDRCVLGLLRPETMGLDPSVPVGSVMQPGPSTFRPSITCGELAAYLEDKGGARAVLTTLDGALVGMVTRDDLKNCRDRAATGDGDDR